MTPPMFATYTQWRAWLASAASIREEIAQLPIPATAEADANAVVLRVEGHSPVMLFPHEARLLAASLVASADGAERRKP